MNRSLWLRSLRRWVSGRPSAVARAKAVRWGPYLHVERLEDRLVPAPIVLNVPLNDTTALIGAINQGDASADGAIINLAPGSVYNVENIYQPPPGSTSGLSGFWFGPSGLPPITNNITINGHGSTIQRDPNSTQEFRLFFVSGGQQLSGNVAAMAPGTLTLNNMTIANGLEKGGDSSTGGGGLGAGGAIFNMGKLILGNVTLTNNKAIGGDSGVTTDTFTGTDVGPGGGGMGGDAPSPAATVGGIGGGGMGGTLGFLLGVLPQGGPGSGNGAGGGGAGFTQDGQAANGATPGNGGGTSQEGSNYSIGNQGNGDGGGGGPGPTPTVNAIGGTGGVFGRGGQNGYSGGGGGIGGGGGVGLSFLGGGGGFGGGGGSGLVGGGPGGFGGGGAIGATAGFGITQQGAGFGGGGNGGGGAGMGGAIFNFFGDTNLTNVTISGNTAQGGLADPTNAPKGTGGSGFGGGIMNVNGVLVMTYVTVGGNQALGGTGPGDPTNGIPGQGTADGFGLFNLSFGILPDTGLNGTAMLPSNATLKMFNSIIGQNTGNTVGVDLVNNATYDRNVPPIVTIAHVQGSTNLVTTSAVHDGNGITLLDPGVILNQFVGPNLGPLQINAVGPPTMALNPTSAAAQVANTSLPNLPVLDQRGFSRQGLPVDLGAYQNQYTVTTAVPATTLFNPNAPTQVTLVATVTSRGHAVQEGQITFVVPGLANATGQVNSQGIASVTITIPPRFGPGNLQITAAYHDPANVFTDSNNKASLIVSAGNTATTITNVTNQYPFLGFAQLSTVTAHVSNQFGLPITEGAVIFQVNGLTIVAPVINGTATAVFNTPFLNMAFITSLLSPHALTATYVDNAGVFNSSSTLVTQPAILADFINSLITSFLQLANQQSANLGLR